MKVKTVLSLITALWVSVILVACGSDSSAPVATDYSQSSHWLKLSVSRSWQGKWVSKSRGLRKCTRIFRRPTSIGGRIEGIAIHWSRALDFTGGSSIWQRSCLMKSSFQGKWM